MVSRTFQSRIQHIAPGSPVSAGNTGRPIRQLEERTNYLREQVDSIESQKLLLDEGQSVDPAVEVGQAVFWNADTKRYEQALAGVETDPESGTLVPLASAECLGMVLRKTNATLADVVIGGLAVFDSLSAAITGVVSPGRYYLSASDPGKLTRQRPPVSVVVCHVKGAEDDCDDKIRVLVMPQTRDFLEDHIHYRFDLVCLPAGAHTPPDVGGHHEITDADVTQAGWLPADHASFGGHAPTGANFGYNLAAHGELSRVWPPIPLESAAVFWDKGGGNLTGAAEIPSRGAAPAIVLDQYGIWWMTDCYGDVPWPKTLNTAAESSASITSESLSSGVEICPRADEMRLVLAYATMVFATDKSVVTSLEPDENQPITVVNCDNEPATTGCLKLRIDLDATIDDEEALGGQALKSLVGPGFKFGRGYVAEGLVAGSDNVSLSGTRQRFLTPGNEATDVVHQGIVTVDVDLEPGERELIPSVTRLGDALERPFRGVLYLGLPTGRDSGLRMKFYVPTAGLPTNPKLKLRVLLFGRGSAGPLAAVTAGYHRLIAPVTGTPTPIVEGDTALPFDVVTPSAGLLADRTISVESDEFTIAAGDTVHVQLSRAADATPAYDNDIGIIRVVGVIVPGE